MKTTPYAPLAASYSWQPETIAAYEAIAMQNPKSISTRDARLSLETADPCLVMVDAALRWIKAYRARFESSELCYVSKPEMSGVLSGLRSLLNFDGGAKMERDARDLDNPASDWTDSKENGMIESLYWTACELAGIDGNNI